MIKFAKRNFDRVSYLDDVDKLFQQPDQKKWYFSKIRFLEAIYEFEQGKNDLAELKLNEAYSYHKHFGDEKKFAFDWLVTKLKGENLHNYPNLRYVQFRFCENDKRYDYEAELEKLKAECCVLEIGAMDGVKFDSLYRPITEYGWSAVVVEPLNDMFQKLKENYAKFPNVKCANVAITDRSGPITMYRILPDTVKKAGHEEWVLGISSIEKTFLLEMNKDSVTEERVDGITFDELIERYQIEKVDVLQIDTEGHDLVVLNSIDLNRFAFRIVRIEVVHLMPSDRIKVFEILEKHGFEFSFDGGDVTAVR